MSMHHISLNEESLLHSTISAANHLLGSLSYMCPAKLVQTHSGMLNISFSEESVLHAPC